MDENRLLDDGPETTAEDVERILVEIVLGMMWGDPRSLVPRTERNAEIWAKVAAEVEELEAAGHEIEVPFEVPLPD